MHCQIFCPPMAVRHLSPGLSETDQIDARVVLTGESGAMDGVCRFPKTKVWMRGKKPGDHSITNPLHWTVDACVAFSPAGSLMRVASSLPEEPCTIEVDFHHGLEVYMLAHAISAPTEIIVDGKMFTGNVIYPNVRAYHTEKGVWTVDAVVATGTMQ